MASRRRVDWTREAQRNLAEVLEFIAQDSHDGARQVLEQAVAAAKSLSTLSHRGRVVPEVNDRRIREIFVHRYRLIYRVESDVVSILAIIYGARDFERPRPDL